MSSDSKPLPESNGSNPLSLINRFSRVRLKQQEGKILLILPPEDKKESPSNEWSQLQIDLQYRLDNSEHFWQVGTEVYLQAGNRLLDGRQIQNIDSIEGTSNILDLSAV